MPGLRNARASPGLKKLVAATKSSNPKTKRGNLEARAPEKSILHEALDAEVVWKLRETQFTSYSIHLQLMHIVSTIKLCSFG